MPDAYTTMMSDHLADCYQACGLSPTGAVQAANQQAPSSAVDQAMLKEHMPPVLYGTPPTTSSEEPFSVADQAMLKAFIHDTTMPRPTSSGPYIPKETPPPGLQTAPSQTRVVSMG